MSKAPREVQKQIDLANNIQSQIKGGDPSKDAEPEQNLPPKNDQVDWEHRFKTQKQKYDELVPKLRDENLELGGRVSELEKLIEKVEPDANPAAQGQPIFTEAEIEEYGSDFLDLVTRVAGNRQSPDTDISNELKELKGQFDQIAKTQAKTAEGRFFDDLLELVPDWETINDDPLFQTWLSEEMPLTGKERQLFLTNAQNALNVRKVASFFTTWKGEAGQSTYMPDTVANGGRGESPEEVDNDIITKAEIAGFYDDKRRGRWKGKEKEADQLEMKIFRAQKENRVR